jgi:hypothetical protein
MIQVIKPFAGALALFILVAVPQAWAQGAPHVTPLMVTSYLLKPDHVAEWKRLEEQQVVPALKAAGITHRAVYATVVGPATEVRVFQPVPGFGIFDEADALEKALGPKKAAALKARLAACLQSVSRQMENRRDDFLIDPGTARVQFASKYRAMPGKSGAYMTFFHDWMMPAMTKAKANGTFAGLEVTVSRHGGEWGLITLYMYYDSFAPLDGEPPVAKTLGPDKTRELLAAGAGLIDPLEWIVRERQDALSF